MKRIILFLTIIVIFSFTIDSVSADIRVGGLCEENVPDGFKLYLEGKVEDLNGNPLDDILIYVKDDLDLFGYTFDGFFRIEVEDCMEYTVRIPYQPPYGGGEVPMYPVVYAYRSTSWYQNEEIDYDDSLVGNIYYTFSLGETVPPKFPYPEYDFPDVDEVEPDDVAIEIPTYTLPDVCVVVSGLNSIIEATIEGANAIFGNCDEWPDKYNCWANQILVLDSTTVNFDASRSNYGGDWVDNEDMKWFILKEDVFHDFFDFSGNIIDYNIFDESNLFGNDGVIYENEDGSRLEGMYLDYEFSGEPYEKFYVVFEITTSDSELDESYYRDDITEIYLDNIGIIGEEGPLIFEFYGSGEYADCFVSKSIHGIEGYNFNGQGMEMRKWAYVAVTILPEEEREIYDGIISGEISIPDELNTFDELKPGCKLNCNYAGYCETDGDEFFGDLRNLLWNNPKKFAVCIGKNGEKPDECTEDKSGVIEYSCGSNGYCEAESVECPEDKPSCVNGECVGGVIGESPFEGELQGYIQRLIDEYIEKDFCDLPMSCPLAAGKISEAEENNKLTVDYYVFDIEDEEISSSFNNNPDELLNPILDKIKEFYAHIGDDYTQPSVDIEFVSKLGETEIDKSDLDRYHFALVFTSREGFGDIFWEDPRNFISEIFGESLDLDGLEQLFITEGQKSGLDGQDAIQKGYEVFLREIMMGGEGGIAVAIPNNHITFIYGGQEILRNNEEFINYDSAVAAHEIGHLLSLGHTEEQFVNGKGSLMYPFLDMGGTWTSGRAPTLTGSTAFTCDQVNRINEYLKGACEFGEIIDLEEGQACRIPETLVGKLAEIVGVGDYEDCPEGSSCVNEMCVEEEFSDEVKELMEEDVVIELMTYLLARDENLREEDVRERVGEVLEFYVSINKPKDDILYILKWDNYDFNDVEEIVGSIKGLDYTETTKNDILPTAFQRLRVIYHSRAGDFEFDSRDPLYDTIDPLIELEVEPGLANYELDQVHNLLNLIIWRIRDENIFSNLIDRLIILLHEKENGENVLPTLHNIILSSSLKFDSNHPMYYQLDFLMTFLDGEYKYVVHSIFEGLAMKSRIIGSGHPLYNIIDPLVDKLKSNEQDIRSIRTLKEITKRLEYNSVNPNHPMYNAIEPLVDSLSKNRNLIIAGGQLNDQTFFALKEISKKLNQESKDYLNLKLTNLLSENHDLKEKAQNQLQALLYIPGEPIHIDYDYASMEYQGKEYVIGGSHHINLDSTWYADMIPEAINYDIDPYFYVAYTILEFRGVSVKNEQVFAPDPTSQALARLGVDFDYTLRSGAGGCIWADASRAKITDMPQIKTKISQLKSNYNPTVQDDFQARNPKSPLNQQSFIFLQYYYGIIMNHIGLGHSMYYSIQTIQGVGKLPRLFEKGDYPNEADIEITGAELPLYGKSLAELMEVLYANPKIRELVPEDADTPLMDKVFELGFLSSEVSS